MLFSSLVFLFVFLPVILLVYYTCPAKGKNIVLLIFSFLFYAWGGIAHTFILLLSIILNYFIAKKIASKTQSKSWLTIGVSFNVLVLITFKYLGFIIANLNAGFNFIGGETPFIEEVSIALPLGISFFTFQQMSMLWDLYRATETKKLKFVDTALYVSFFPQLIAGPIVRYHDMIGQISIRKETVALMNKGIKRFIIGLFKKVIVANTFAWIVDTILTNELEMISTSAAWLTMIAYSFQIFFDFSGYSDMAIGLGSMFGFKIPENFNFPYIATSVQDFWRRWHISLSTWFRDYVYISLGGNRNGKLKLYRNLIIVFLLTGLWHGATWSFVFWGIFHGFFLLIERSGFNSILNKIPQFFGWIYTMFIVLIAWVFFRIENFDDALTFCWKLFGVGSGSEIKAIQFIDYEKMFVLLLAITLSVPWKKSLFKWHPVIKTTFINATLLLIFLCTIAYLNAGSYNPFIYFNF